MELSVSMMASDTGVAGLPIAVSCLRTLPISRRKEGGRVRLRNDVLFDHGESARRGGRTHTRPQSRSSAR